LTFSVNTMPVWMKKLKSNCMGLQPENSPFGLF
jgi:hypothetical protein